MQKLHVLAALGTVLVIAALAQSEADYQAIMKSNAATMGSLNKNIMAKDGAAAAADAQKLEGNFKEVEAFWKTRGGADDAVDFAMKAQNAAAAVAKATSDGNFDKAAVDAKNLQANCGGCHRAHREGSAGSFKIK